MKKDFCTVHPTGSQGVLFLSGPPLLRSFFTGLIFSLTSKAGLHPSWKLAQASALLRINFAFGPDYP
jgi:hypothetical protein